MLTAIALAGCATHDATGNAESTRIDGVDGGVGRFLGGDGAASGLEVAIKATAYAHGVPWGLRIAVGAGRRGPARLTRSPGAGVQGSGSTVQVCPAATTTCAVWWTTPAHQATAKVVVAGNLGSASVTAGR